MPPSKTTKSNKDKKQQVSDTRTSSTFGIDEAAKATAQKIKGLIRSINDAWDTSEDTKPQSSKPQYSSKHRNPRPHPPRYAYDNQGQYQNPRPPASYPPRYVYDNQGEYRNPRPPAFYPGHYSSENQEEHWNPPAYPANYVSENQWAQSNTTSTTERTPPQRYKPKPPSYPASMSGPGTQSCFVAGQNDPFAMGDWNRRNEEKQQHLRTNPIPLYSSESYFGFQGHPTEVGGTPNRKSNAAFLGELERNTLKRFSHEELKKLTSGFADRVGHGGFGSVYRGKFLNGTEIVVKVLEENDFIEETFEAEVSTMFKASHRYLVKCYGYCFDVNMKAIVYEYMENGSLDALLYGNPCNFEWKLFYIIAIKTAKGLSYLHDGCVCQIIHHDLKPANVLIDKNLHVKITDFGVARIMNANVDHVTWTKLRGTPGFLAPEMSMPGSEITYKCDVYSFGIMLFEILGMRSSGGGLDWFPKHVWSKFENDELDQLIDECGIQEEYRLRAKVLSMVALWCIQFTPQARPSMSTVVKMLEGEMQVMEPPNPFYPAPESSCSKFSTSPSLDK